MDIVVEKKKTRNRVRKSPFLMCTFYSILLFESIAISFLEGSNSAVFKALLVRYYKYLLSLFSLSVHILLNSRSTEA